MSSLPLSTAIARLSLVLGVPGFLVLVVIPVLGRSTQRVAGLPLSVLALFFSFGLVALCMAVAWFAFDRHAPGLDDADG
ncbi:hypothetical protein AA103196_1375 [Ameyamaea chiangmaiensis NBRC 103196]|uniref:Uncharacterized protein n=1 Tax=Ameyamaea chiangmaiensis TaxID=442969 RepID=A0A850PEC1_9PROT|nr:hypothetical protein [Ameyamaea chiangmaiensis]MBS4075196.1 hypothetical protein [Ameyamaea chiangmaiensis]NVN41213.1 hypothetical protein [Ameyamaea chiangmaiensis]GBQ66375.1 hypothetical protein AA103196_1375 [Ameyamaea chiangmaiensis NBRC 103196]